MKWKHQRMYAESTKTVENKQKHEISYSGSTASKQKALGQLLDDLGLQIPNTGSKECTQKATRQYKTRDM